MSGSLSRFGLMGILFLVVDWDFDEDWLIYRVSRLHFFTRSHIKLLIWLGSELRGNLLFTLLGLDGLLPIHREEVHEDVILLSEVLVTNVHDSLVGFVLLSAKSGKITALGIYAALSLEKQFEFSLCPTLVFLLHEALAGLVEVLNEGLAVFELIFALVKDVMSDLALARIKLLVSQVDDDLRASALWSLLSLTLLAVDDLLLNHLVFLVKEQSHASALLLLDVSPRLSYFPCLCVSTGLSRNLNLQSVLIELLQHLGVVLSPDLVPDSLSDALLVGMLRSVLKVKHRANRNNSSCGHGCSEGGH